MKKTNPLMSSLSGTGNAHQFSGEEKRDKTLWQPGLSCALTKVPYSQASGICGNSVKSLNDEAHTR